MTDLCSTELQVNSSTASVIPENSSNDNESKGTDTRSFIEGGTDTTGYNGLEYDYHFTFSKSLISQLHPLFSTKPELLQFSQNPYMTILMGAGIMCGDYQRYRRKDECFDIRYQANKQHRKNQISKELDH